MGFNPQYQVWHARQFENLGVDQWVSQSITAIYEDLIRLSNTPAETANLGLVLQMELVNQVSSPDASNAPVAYSQSQIQEIVDLCNETKAQLNALLTESINAGQMSDT